VCFGTPSQDALKIDVTACRYAEFYKELGEPELGFLLVCTADFATAGTNDRGRRIERKRMRF
jgi:L-2-amino-thiazoline-4-carboxylic acid hydrolase